MNFTHLMPDHLQPEQGLLQKYTSYLVLVALDDDMIQLVLDTTRFDFESADNVLCQIVLPEHLELAKAGTLLGALKSQLYANRRTPNIFHSFIASTTKDELVAHPPSGGEYFPLMLNTLETYDEKIAHLKQSVFDAIHRTKIVNKSEKIATSFKVLGPAASLAATIYRYAHGIP